MYLIVTKTFPPEVGGLIGIANLTIIFKSQYCFTQNFDSKLLTYFSNSFSAMKDINPTLVSNAFSSMLNVLV